MIEQTVSIERMEDAIDIFGSFDENIRIIEQELAVRVVSRDDQLKISGEEDEAVDQACSPSLPGGRPSTSKTSAI